MGAGHDHGETQINSRLNRILLLIAGVLAIATVIGLVAYRPTGENRPDLRRIGVVSEFHDARTLSVTSEPCPGTTEVQDVICTTAELRLLEGPDEGSVIDLEVFTNAGLRVGDKVVLSFDARAPEGFNYFFSDFQRRPPMFWLAILFSVAVIALGRLKGVAALVALAVSLVLLVQFTLPAILDGRSPVMIAVITASALAFVALYTSHGISAMATVSLLGTLSALGLTTALAAAFTSAARFSGLSTEEAVFLQGLGVEVDLSGLLLAGAVIGTLGALDDVTVTQASAVFQLRKASPTASTMTIARQAIDIGRDHISATVNTLFLAYAGASLPLLLIFVLSNQGIGDIATSEVVATEILRTLVGSIGLVAAVPVTTWLASIVTQFDRSEEAPDFSQG